MNLTYLWRPIRHGLTVVVSRFTALQHHVYEHHVYEHYVYEHYVYERHVYEHRTRSMVLTVL